MRRKSADIAVAVAVAILGAATLRVHMPGPVIVILGLGLFAAVGYVWSEVLLSPTAPAFERAMVAAGLALLAPIFGGIAVYAAKVPLHRAAWVALLAALIIVGVVVLGIQRLWGAKPAAPPQPGRDLPVRHVFAFGMAVVIATAAVALSVRSAETQKYPGYTQLWMSPVVNNPLRANLGVTNQEGGTLEYRLVLLAQGKVSDTWNVILANGGTWRRTIPYTTKSSLTADLYRLPNLTQPYRHVDNGG